jgi:hypothetical protein
VFMDKMALGIPLSETKHEIEFWKMKDLPKIKYVNPVKTIELTSEDSVVSDQKIANLMRNEVSCKWEFGESIPQRLWPNWNRPRKWDRSGILVLNFLSVWLKEGILSQGNTTLCWEIWRAKLNKEPLQQNLRRMMFLKRLRNYNWKWRKIWN